MDTLSVKERFDSKFIWTPGCWIWKGVINRGGYGRLTVAGKGWTASRLSYQLYVGELEPGKLVCHKCDNRRCVNPDHLYLGTHRDNVHDMITRGRTRSEFTPEEILKIRADSRSDYQIADEYGAKRSTIWMIRAGRNWAHIDVEPAITNRSSSRRVGGYSQAIQWIALNDSTEWLNDENGSPPASIRLVADIFYRTVEKATADLRAVLSKATGEHQ